VGCLRRLIERHHGIFCGGGGSGRRSSTTARDPLPEIGS
jgi:hypothetical protein